MRWRADSTDTDRKSVFKIPAIFADQKPEQRHTAVSMYRMYGNGTPLLQGRSVNIDRPLSQLKILLCSVFFGEPSSPLQPEHQYCADSREQNHSFPFSDSTLTTTTMSSNASPMTTSPDRPSTNNPQDLLITPNHIPGVTQTEENSPFDHLIPGRKMLVCALPLRCSLETHTF
jgi:hypothetical protein